MKEFSRSFDFHLTTKLLFGVGELQKLGDEIKKLAAKKALLVTDSQLAQTEVFQKVCQQLKQSGIDYVQYTEVEPNPTVQMMDRGSDVFRSEGCEVVVGVGGGSSMDTAKGIGVVVANGGSIRDYCGAFKVKKPSVPVIAIPTTTGTGSEVSWHISVKDKASNFKLSVRSNLAVPTVSILDPQMVTSLPARVAAETGMDALSHLFESYTSTNASPLMDLFALEGIRRIGKYFRQFYANRKDLDAAANMLYAAMLGGIVISHARTGAVHALARPVGAHFDVSHGLAVGILLPYLMEYNWIAYPEKFIKTALAFGEDTSGLAVDEAALKAVEAVRKLHRDLGLPTRLSEVGVKEEAIPILAADAIETGSAAFNPRAVGQKELEGVLKKAF